jgi:hypothetical protein
LFEQAKLVSPLYERMQDPEYSDAFMKALEPIEDGSVDPGDEELVVERMLEMLGEEYLASLRRGAEIHLELTNVYERLRNASEDEIRAFARLQLEAQLRGTGMLENFAKSAIALKQAEEQLENVDNELQMSPS